jgi:hypothetical protein
MDRKATDTIVTAIGIDIGKNMSHLVGKNVGITSRTQDMRPTKRSLL